MAGRKLRFGACSRPKISERSSLRNFASRKAAYASRSRPGSRTYGDGTTTSNERAILLAGCTLQRWQLCALGMSLRSLRAVFGEDSKRPAHEFCATRKTHERCRKRLPSFVVMTETA